VAPIRPPSLTHTPSKTHSSAAARNLGAVPPHNRTYEYIARGYEFSFIAPEYPLLQYSAICIPEYAFCVVRIVLKSPIGRVSVLDSPQLGYEENCSRKLTCKVNFG